MSLADILRALARRWPLVLLGLVATAGLLFASVTVVKPNNTVTSEVLLMPPSTLVPEGGNPYLALGGLDVMASVTSRSLTDDRTRQLIEKEFGELEYTVDLDPLSPAPLVQIIVEADDPKVAAAAERRLDGLLRTALTTLQDDAAVPAAARVTTTDVVLPTDAKVSHKSQLRMAAVALVLGLGSTVGLTLLLDAWLRARAARKQVDKGVASP